MNKYIESTVEQCSQLTLKLNKGERHRIMRNGMERGSLWVTPRSSCYCVAVTGEVESLLYSFFFKEFGQETGVDQGRKYWNISDIGDVAKIVRRFDSTFK